MAALGYVETRPRGGDVQLPAEAYGAFLTFFLLLNPGATATVLLPLGALLLYRRPRALLGYCVVTGLIVLLNGACWGLLSTRPGW